MEKIPDSQNFGWDGNSSDGPDQALMSLGWATPTGQHSLCLWMDWRLPKRKGNNRLPPMHSLMFQTWYQLKNPKWFFLSKKDLALAQGSGWDRRAQR
jgi:hypothetical protein